MEIELKGWILVGLGIAIMAASFGIAWGVSAAMFMIGLGVMGCGAVIISDP